MRKEHAYGIVPLRFHEGVCQVLLVQHHPGHWAFPKGHADREETPQQAAERELREETRLTIERYLLLDPITESYLFTFQGERISKTVHYFIALVKGQVMIQEDEIQASEWLSLTEAFMRITFKESKQVCQ
jgi:8-oxo-dGTP pyrophosphatase MutT (NUDIX family)